eukprot:222374-Pleurochrysis_carterae.AAC.3
MSCPTDELLAAAQHVLMYLSHHRAVGLRFSRAQLPVSGFSDSHWATRHSTSGYDFMYSQAAISWASKKQPSVALSSCAAEIIAASEATKEAVYLRSLFTDLAVWRLASLRPLPWTTNPPSTWPTTRSTISGRSTSTAATSLWLRERIESHDITVPYVNSADNLADFLPKPLPPRVCFTMRDTIMNVAH